MKLSRTLLIERARDRVTAAVENYNKAMRIYTDRVKESEADYYARYGGLWRAFAERIDENITHARPITVDDVPEELRAHGGGIRFYIKGRRRDRIGIERFISKPTKPDVSDLESLIGFLEAVTEDEVTLASLERAGFRRIGTLFSQQP